MLTAEGVEIAVNVASADWEAKSENKDVASEVCEAIEEIEDKDISDGIKSGLGTDDAVSEAAWLINEVGMLEILTMCNEVEVTEGVTDGVLDLVNFSGVGDLDPVIEEVNVVLNDDPDEGDILSEGKGWTRPVM